MKTLSIFLFLSAVLFFKSFSQNHPPVAVNDTVYGFFGYPYLVHLLQNDYDPDGDSIYVYNLPQNSGVIQINDSTWEFSRTGHSIDYRTSTSAFNYIIKDENGAIAFAKVVLMLKAPLRYDSLDINNIKALISPVGQHFWDFENPHFEVPKGSGKMAVLNHSLWFVCHDVSGQLLVAAESYRQSGTDFTQGPITTVMDSTYDKKWNRVWKLNKTDIRYHISNWSNSGYQPIEAIRDWPTHGDVSHGETANIAPFYDHDNNDIYNPSAGDYPLIRGDQAVFFVFNDSAYIHTESQSEKLGIEIHGMAYAFDKPGDSLLFNTLFFHYDIINRSQADYHDTYIGMFADFDLGNPVDDYVGSDVTNGMVYDYNSDILDEDTTFVYGNFTPGYGVHPPALGLKVIGGPYLPEDGIDNPANGCDYSMNGLNFGDNVVDNERSGATNCNNCYQPQNNYGDPPYAVDYYNSIRSLWADGTHFIFGGNGHPGNGGIGPDCNFMFPGNSDTICNWGTQGLPPNGDYNQNGKYWTEGEVNNVPGDRRGLASVGPFALNSGQSIPLDYCFTFARDFSGDNMASVELLRERVSTIPSQVGNLISLPVTYYSIDEKPKPSSLTILPNPAQDWIIVVSEEKSDQQYQVFDYSGKYLSEGLLHEGNNQVNIQHLKSGIYLLKSGNRWGRFIKM